MTEQEEKLPPWRIEHEDGELCVTDGTVCFACKDSISALRRTTS